ncbi:MAG: branched-chain amino acid ABC transporter permease [Marinovum sp.]|jgi:predicted branched-subunit amino acid permease|nr:branched-chain amino acid ABC transporter permease [Marinovum sp.]MBT6506876.1 branched-chain amino acid ABC transporter permease [Marinovum sp.]MBT6534169.1 branched-chain amino acid ABC transporter permease [Marinovum sp.]
MSIPEPSGFFIQGVLNGAPHSLVIGPFGFLFGVVATEAGLSIFETLSFSVLVVAGAAQLTALELMQDNTPTVIVILSALALNLRMALYSASLTPHLGTAGFWQRAAAAYSLVDQSYATSILQYENNPEMTMPQKLTFFFGVAASVIPVWYLLTFLGALVGQSIPTDIPLDFATPLTFIALLAPLLRSLPHILAALASVIAGLLFHTMPYNLGIMLAGVIGMSVGAWSEQREFGEHHR